LEKRELISLIHRHLKGETTELENSLIQNWLDSFQNGDAWNETAEGSKSELLSGIHEQLLSEISQPSLGLTKKPVRIHWMRWAAAAAVLVAVTITAIRFLQPASNLNAPVTAQVIKDIQPGTKHTYVTLGDGQQVVLDNVKVGEMVGDAIKMADGKLAYTNTNTQAVTYNTVTVPRGGVPQYVELPDHTLVWLNSESSITYPTAFTGDKRIVDMKGEVYYEVAKDGRHFYAQTRNDKIEVTGTHFNIRAYDDQPHVQTTLLEGSVTIGNKKLAPGEQFENGNIRKVNSAEIDRIMAWKYGLLAYDKVDVQTLMRDLGRYYDVDVVFEGEPTKQTFEGKIGRSLTLKQVLNGLQFTELNYRIEKRANGNRIVMLP
jgi:hypothetical protein